MLHHLQIWLLHCLFRSIRSLIKEQKKTNRLTRVLQCHSPLSPQHPSGPDTVICHLPMFISQEPTFVCGPGWYPSVRPFVLWVKVMGRAILGIPVNPTLTISYSFRVFKLNCHTTSHVSSKCSRTYHRHQSVNNLRLEAMDICECPVNFQWPAQGLTHRSIEHGLSFIRWYGNKYYLMSN